MEDEDFVKDLETVLDEEHQEIEQFVEDQERRQAMADNAYRPRMRLKDYVMTFILGLGIGIGATFYCSKRLEVNVHVSEANKKGYVNAHGRQFSQQAYNLFESEFIRMRALSNNDDCRISYSLAWVMGNKGEVIPDDRVKQVLDVACSPETPIGKLWFQYKGPEKPPALTPAEKAKMTALYAQYKDYQQLIHVLIDPNGDQMYSEDELNKAAYKVLH